MKHKFILLFLIVFLLSCIFVCHQVPISASPLVETSDISIVVLDNEIVNNVLIKKPQTLTKMPSTPKDITIEIEDEDNSLQEEIVEIEPNEQTQFVDWGNNINFIINTDIPSISETITVPLENVFGKYYQNAITVYNSILNGNESVTIYFYNETDEATSTEKIKDNLRQDLLSFLYIFNAKAMGELPWIDDWGEFVENDDEITLTATFNLSHIYEGFNTSNQISSYYHNANIEAGLYNGMSELEAVNKISAFICKKLSYQSGEIFPDIALNTGYGNCVAYAKFFQNMCQDAGISSKIITGCVYSDNIENTSCPNCHMWNQVKIGYNWYYIDVCWLDNGTEYGLTTELWNNRSIYSIQ